MSPKRPPTPAGGRRPDHAGEVLGDPTFQRFAGRIRKELIPKLEDSGSYMAVLSAGVDSDIGIKFAVELGLAIMMDKPIILAVAPGAAVPDHLVRAADEIVEIDLEASSADTHIVLGQAIKRVHAKFGLLDEGEE